LHQLYTFGKVQGEPQGRFFKNSCKTAKTDCRESPRVPSSRYQTLKVDTSHRMNCQTEKDWAQGVPPCCTSVIDGMIELPKNR